MNWLGNADRPAGSGSFIKPEKEEQKSRVLAWFFLDTMEGLWAPRVVCNMKQERQSLEMLFSWKQCLRG